METLQPGSITIAGLADLPRAAKAFLAAVRGERIIAFYGSMGAGKTTFTTALCAELGVSGDSVSSPTFAIVNEYRACDGRPIYHFDFYRIERLEEALDIGLYDYLDDPDALCLIEWPENIEPLLPEETLRVRIEVAADGNRTLSWPIRN